MAKVNRGTLDNGRRYQQLRDPDGQHYQATTPVELHNLTTQGYALPDGVDLAEASEYLAHNLGARPEPPATTAAAGSAGGGSATAAATSGGGSGTGTAGTGT